MALLHHVTFEALHDAFHSLRKDAAAGVDGVTWEIYADGLEGRLADLCARVHRGAYRAPASRRVFIPKEDGGQRPLGIAALEDKVLQRAVTDVILVPIYETEFLGFSYGFRPGRGTHNALDAVTVGIDQRRVNWIVDADIRGFFDNLDRDHLVRMLGKRIGDKRVIRLIVKWLNAGVMEGTDWSDTGRGTPQGAIVSACLANVYLHYVLDDWFHNTWRKRIAEGDTIIVRYADDFVGGFQHQGDAKRFLRDLGERLAHYGLELHPDKTRLIEFGRFARENRRKRGQGKPETFDFLGMTHFCDREGEVQGRSQTVPETGPPHPAADQGRASQAVARQPARDGQVDGTGHQWLAQLLCRSREQPRLAEVYPPLHAIVHACPSAALSKGPHRLEGHRPSNCCPLAQSQNPPPVAKSAPCRHDPREEPDANSARPDLCGGIGVTRFPTAIRSRTGLPTIAGA